MIILNSTKSRDPHSTYATIGLPCKSRTFFVGCIIFLKLNIFFAKLAKILFVYMFVLSQEINVCGADNRNSVRRV